MDYKKPALQLLIILALIITGIGLMALDGRPTSAAPLLQIPTNTPPPPPTNTPAPPPTNTPVPLPTNTPVVAPTNTPIGPTNTPVPGLTGTPAPPAPPKKGGGGAPPGPSGTPTAGGCVRSIGKDGVSLSTEPGFYQPHVQIAPRGDILFVVQGPVRADTIWWWLLSTNTGVQGWGNQDDITPDPGPCAFGSSVSSGGQVPPYPITIVPSYVLGQPPVIEQAPVQAAPPVQPAPQPTPAQQQALPQTGDSLAWWFLAGLLAVTMIAVGFVRRRLQTQPAVRSKTLADDETDTEEQQSS